MAGIGLALLQNSARAKGEVDPVTHSIRVLLGPGAEAASQAAVQTKQTAEAWSSGPALLRENEALKLQVAALQAYAADSVLLKSELDQIKAMAEIPLPPNRSVVHAKVIGFWPIESRMTLNVGRKHGIKPDLAVLSPDGLAAVIETVEETRSQALLISSPSVRIGAMIARPAPSYGLLRGLKFDELTVEIPGSAPIEVNDKVLTSGLSDVIPGGIAIGEVTKVGEQSGFGTRQVTVFPRFRIVPGQRLAVVK